MKSINALLHPFFRVGDIWIMFAGDTYQYTIVKVHEDIDAETTCVDVGSVTEKDIIWTNQEIKKSGIVFINR